MSQLTPGDPPQKLRDRYPEVNWERCTIEFQLGSKSARSRIGGRPQLEPGVEWPTRNGVPMVFVAQIAIDELPDEDAEFFSLPATGLLSFFYDLAGGPRGDKKEDFGGGCVLHIAAPNDEASEPPAGLPEGGDFSAMPIRPEHTHPPSDWWALGVQGVNLEDSLVEEYLDAVGDQRFEVSGGCHSQMFGDPLEIQESMVVSLFDNCGNWVPKPKADEPWILLMQVDSHKETGMNWVDKGRIYYWIREHDLLAGRYERLWTIVQFY